MIDQMIFDDIDPRLEWIAAKEENSFGEDDLLILNLDNCDHSHIEGNNNLGVSSSTSHSVV